MKKTVMILLTIAALVLIPAMAQDTANVTAHGYGNGNGNHGNGNGNGNGNGGNGGNGGGGNCWGNPIYNIYDGTPFSFNGTAVTCGMNGSQLAVSTENGNLTVTGLGPTRYWDNLGVTKPAIDDAVSGNGYTVDYNGMIKNVLTDITVNGITVELRDADGRPLWFGAGYGGNGEGNRYGGGFGGPYYNILNGTPFTYQGEVIGSCTMGQGISGSGLVLATTEGNIEVHGLGPIRFWENLDADRPVVGDVITANGYAVDFNGTIVNVLISITLGDGTIVQLRDPETGAPLWRGGRGFGR